MSKWEISAKVTAYGILWFLTWAALLADLQGRHCHVARRLYRQDLGFSMMMALLPPMWFVAPGFTGFYEYGFQVFPLDGCGGEK